MQSEATPYAEKGGTKFVTQEYFLDVLADLKTKVDECVKEYDTDRHIKQFGILFDALETVFSLPQRQVLVTSLMELSRKVKDAAWNSNSTGTRLSKFNSKVLKEHACPSDSDLGLRLASVNGNKQYHFLIWCPKTKMNAPQIAVDDVDLYAPEWRSYVEDEHDDNVTNLLKDRDLGPAIRGKLPTELDQELKNDEELADWLVQSPAEHRGWILKAVIDASMDNPSIVHGIRKLVCTILPVYDEWQRYIADLTTALEGDAKPLCAIETLVEIVVAAYDKRPATFKVERGSGIVGSSRIRLWHPEDDVPGPNQGIQLEATDCLNQVLGYLEGKMGLVPKSKLVDKRLKRMHERGREDDPAYYAVYRPSDSQVARDNVRIIRQELPNLHLIALGEPEDEAALDPFLLILRDEFSTQS